MASTSAATARTAAHLAGEAFRHHRLTRDGAHWLCRSPKCGESFAKFDAHGRPRRFVTGHNTQKAA